MQRWKLKLEYDGSRFAGWQSQAEVKGVQDALEQAIHRIEGVLRRTHAAGRTDRGVHATGQIVHVDLEKPWQAWHLREALNAWLRDIGPVAVLEAVPVDDSFHARFSAQGRAYLYRIMDRRPPLTIDNGRVWKVTQALDLAPMQAAASLLVGTHDFTTFRDAQCQAKSPIKTLDVFTLSRVRGNFGDEIHAVIEARSFLHRQVRSMIGSLAEVGRGKWPVERIASALAACDRKHCGPVAPSEGLYLTGVKYDGMWDGIKSVDQANA